MEFKIGDIITTKGFDYDDDSSRPRYIIISFGTSKYVRLCKCQRITSTKDLERLSAMIVNDDKLSPNFNYSDIITTIIKEDEIELDKQYLRNQKLIQLGV